MPEWIDALICCAYVALCRWAVQRSSSAGRAPFAVINLAIVYYFYYRKSDAGRWFPVYVAALAACYVALRYWSRHRGDRLFWLVFLMPIGLLVLVRYLPLPLLAVVSGWVREKLRFNPDYHLAIYFTGLSYIAFRTSQLALEVRNGVVKPPGFWDYLGFAFFAPTFAVGPISPYSHYLRAFAGSNRPEIPIGRALLRILVGAVKYRFFGGLLNQFTYTGLLLDEYRHPWVDLPVAVIGYYLYLYCNFSGFCDIAIGAAGLMGIPVAENFDCPLGARNVKDFWNRWHITLSQWMRDMVFSPLSKSLVRAFGPARANHAIALTIAIVFLLVGVWHGVGWNYAAFGALHALGVVANHYYTIALKKWLGKERFAAYNQNRLIQAAAVVLTFVYVAASLFFFANDGKTMARIFDVIGWY